MPWEIAGESNKKFKLFMDGPPGSFKTRAALRLADNGDRNQPAAGIIDTEFGTEHYGGEFAFMRLQEQNPDVILREVTKMVKSPGDVRTLIIDSFSVYYDALLEKWVDLFALREKTSAGNKTDYYTMQPRDYVHVNRDAAKLVRMLLKCDLNIICICQVKDQWEGMKVVGSVFDGWKRLPYYFDTRIQIEANPKKEEWIAKVRGKDRSNSFKPGEIIPWKDDASIVEYMTKKMGQTLSGGVLAKSFDPDAAPVADKLPEETATVEVVQPAEKAEKAAAPAEEKAPDKSADESADKAADKAAEEIVEASPDDAPTEAKDKSGQIDKAKLLEIVKAKKEAKVNDPNIWGKLLAKYEVSTAKDMTMDQADELIKDLIRGEIPT